MQLCIKEHREKAWNKFVQHKGSGQSYKISAMNQNTHPDDILAARVYTLEVMVH